MSNSVKIIYFGFGALIIMFVCIVIQININADTEQNEMERIIVEAIGPVDIYKVIDFQLSNTYHPHTTIDIVYVQNGTTQLVHGEKIDGIIRYDIVLDNSWVSIDGVMP